MTIPRLSSANYDEVLFTDQQDRTRTSKCCVAHDRSGQQGKNEVQIQNSYEKLRFEREDFTNWRSHERCIRTFRVQIPSLKEEILLSEIVSQDE